MPNDVVQQLKEIFEQAGSASNLDDHPWCQSLVVQQYVSDHPSLQDHSPGYQLLATLKALFRETMPSTPPRRGKRLDTKWGQFGILGALYFAPLEFGSVRPTGLLDGWGRIDEVILRYVFGLPAAEIAEKDRQLYRLVGDEFEAAPTSTISDWHVRGLERLAEVFLDREQLLSAQYGIPSPVLDPDRVAGEEDDEHPEPDAIAGPTVQIGFYQVHKKRLWLGIIALLLLLVAWKAGSVLQVARAVRSDISQLEEIISGDIGFDHLDEFGPLLETTRDDILALQRHVGPFRWAGRLLGWLPVYGGDLASAGDLVDMAAGLIVAGDEAYRAGAPFFEVIQADGEITRPSIPEILEMLVDAQPGFETAQEAVNQALKARANIEVERLSPKTRPLLEKVDPYLPWLQDGLTAAVSAPELLGASGYGPQTYMILLQNEDESRPTGGFITAVGIITIENGEIITLTVENSVYIYNPDEYHPPSPWPIAEYMGIEWWFFRDANWRADYPYGALLAETLYAKSRGHSVDGVIAFTQHFFEILLTATGPIQVEGVAEPISAENLLDYMRSSHDAARELGGEEYLYNRKDFLEPLADALMRKVLEEPDLPWVDLGQAIVRALDEHHMLLQFDDTVISRALGRRGWDGAIHPGDGDFLMVTNTNLGWTKSDAVVDTLLTYDVDLSTPANPEATLTVTHVNNAQGDVDCIHHIWLGRGDSYQGRINHCLWDYLRVYALESTQLVDATPHVVPPKWMITGKLVMPKIDVVYEYLEKIRTWGTFFVVPVGEIVETSFEYTLASEDILHSSDGGDWSYSLYVKKQPGTLAVPLTLRVHVPSGAEVVSSSHDGTQNGAIWTAVIPLRVDEQISVTFREIDR